MTDWIHCNVCITRFRSSIKFYVTSCGHIICNKCVSKSENRNVCSKCNLESELVEICGNMDSNIELYFHPLSETVNKLSQICSFQQSNMSSLVKNIMVKYNLAKAEIIKVRDDNTDLKLEIDKLRQQVKDSEKRSFAPPMKFSTSSFANSTISKHNEPLYAFANKNFVHKPTMWTRPLNGRMSMQQRRADINKSQDTSAISASLRSDASSTNTPVKRSGMPNMLPMVHLTLGSNSRSRFIS